jgi:hypothetical protein
MRLWRKDRKKEIIGDAPRSYPHGQRNMQRRTPARPGIGIWMRQEVANTLHRLTEVQRGVLSVVLQKSQYH